MTIQEVAEATAVNLETQAFSIEERFHNSYDLLGFRSSIISFSEPPHDPLFEIGRKGVHRYGQILRDA
jgi:hypothetical protein